MSAVSTERPDATVSTPKYGLPDKSSEIYSTDDEEDHQSFAEYTDTDDDDASESDEDVQFHEATQPLYHPDIQQYEDEHGFTVNVRTDDEYSDDTTDSEYIEEKRRQSQMIAPESMQSIQVTDSESEYEDKIGAVYKSEMPSVGIPSSSQPTSQRKSPIESMQSRDASDLDSDQEEKATPPSTSDAYSRHSLRIRPRSQKITPLESLQSTDASESENERDEKGTTIVTPEPPKSSIRNSMSIRRRSHRITPLDNLRSLDTSDSENEQEDEIAPIVSRDGPKSSMQNSRSVRRTSQRIITPIDDDLVNNLSSYLDPSTQEDTNSHERLGSRESGLTDSTMTEDISHLPDTLVNRRQSTSGGHVVKETLHHEFGFVQEDVEPYTDNSTSPVPSHPANDPADTPSAQHEPESQRKSSVDGATVFSSSQSVEAIQSAYISDFESVSSADTALTTPKTEIEPLDDDPKPFTRLTHSPEPTSDLVLNTSPKDYVDYLQELDQAPELPPKDLPKPASVVRNSNRFSVQSLSDMNDISLDHSVETQSPISEQPQDNRFSLASYNNPMRHSKTLPPIDTSVGIARRSLSSEQSSPRSGNILQNAFRLQTPVNFSNPFKRSPPSSTVTTPRTSISTVHTRPSQAYSARHSKRMSKQLGLASPVIGGSVDEMLLARLEQQNSELRKDPKNRVLQNLQREAVRRSIENLKHDRVSKGTDAENGDFDWGRWFFWLHSVPKA